MTVSEDELAPLVAFARKARDAADWADMVLADAENNRSQLTNRVRKQHLAWRLATLKAAIARAEDALG